MIKAQQRKGRDGMKKHVMMFVVSAALAATLAACGQTTQRSAQMNYIGAEAAKNMATTDAQVQASDAVFTQASLSEKNGTMYYDVEFTAGDMDYTYAIDALTGAVIESNSSAVQAGDTSTTTQTGGVQSGVQGSVQGGSIDEAAAKQIALDHAGVSEGDTAFLMSKADYDDGVVVYDVEFYVASTNTEYDYEIDAATGEIRSYDYDAENYSGTQSTTGETKAEAEIRQIALAKVPGATDKDIQLTLDRDDGKLRYEGKIIYDGTEYEFEIDAYSGAILEWDAESVFS